MKLQALALILFAALFVVACSEPTETPNPAGTQEEGTPLVDDTPFPEDTTEEHTEDELTRPESTGTAITDEPDAIFQITGENFKFMMDGETNPELRVNIGDIVRVEFTSTSGLHDWVVDEFGAATAQVNAPDTTSVTFVADKAGTFEYYCSVGRHRENGMKGNLIVE